MVTGVLPLLPRRAAPIPSPWRTYRRVLAERSILGFRNHGLRAIAIATLIAIASISVHTAPVAATDPTPTAATSPSPATVPPAPPSPTEAPSTAVPPTPTAVVTTPPSSVTTTAPVVAQSATTSSVARPVVKVSEGARVVRIAMAQRGKRYARGSTGPRAFDCSGLVRYSYRLAGVSRRLGGGHSARGIYRWARLHGLTSRANPQIGDIVIYGNGTHAAIYIGHGRVVSALNPRQGIRVTALHALGAPFTTFIHTHI